MADRSGRTMKHLEFYTDYFQKAVRSLEDHGKCVLCKRGFRDNKEKKDFEVLVCRLLARFPWPTMTKGVLGQNALTKLYAPKDKGYY